MLNLFKSLKTSKRNPLKPVTLQIPHHFREALRGNNQKKIGLDGKTLQSSSEDSEEELERLDYLKRILK